MKLLYIVLFALCSVGSGNTCNKKNDCAGAPKADCVCIELYKPVCGCDGKTYSNDCKAACAGVKNWTEGECAK